MAAPPELVDDAIAEIFLRLPPDELARLQALARHPHMRAFLRLGFVDNTIVLHGATSPRLSPTSSMSSFPRRAFDCVCWEALDCRHGRVLQGLFAERVNLVVWDPITGDHRALPDHGLLSGYYSAAVFCAARGCDHLHCRDGGPFRVVLAGMDYFAREDAGVRARLYCSEAAAWVASANLASNSNVMRKPSAVAGDDVYFQLMSVG